MARKLSAKQLAALRKGRAIRAAKLRKTKSPAPRKAPRRRAPKARKAARRTAPPRAKAGPRRAPGLTPQEREGMGLVCDLINAQFPASGNLRDASPWVRGLSDSQRHALVAADRRIKRAAGR